MDEAIGNVRQMSQLLRPTILDDFGLEAGLRWLAEGFHARTGSRWSSSRAYSGRLPDETETHLFRIAQEALTNVARHSGATRSGDHRWQRSTAMCCLPSTTTAAACPPGDAARPAALGHDRHARARPQRRRRRHGAFQARRRVF